MKTKIMILGSGGMIGHVLTAHFKSLDKYEVVTVNKGEYCVADYYIDVEKSLLPLNIAINIEKPDVVINCIGLLIQESNRYPDRAIFVNGYLPHYLEGSLRDTGTKLIQMSTNCVFEGDKPVWTYDEDDVPEGRSWYARTKALGEVRNTKDLTIRTSTIGGEVSPHATGLLDWFVSSTGSVKGYSEMLWNGITTPMLAKYLDALIEQNVCGLMHLSCPFVISKYDLLLAMRKGLNSDTIVEEDYTVHQSRVLACDDVYRVDMDYDHERMIAELLIWIKEHDDLYKGKYGKL